MNIEREFVELERINKRFDGLSEVHESVLVLPSIRDDSEAKPRKIRSDNSIFVGQ